VTLAAVFKQSAEVPRLYVNTDSSVPGWSAFLFLGNPDPKSLQASIDLKTSWQGNLPGGGCYVFGPREPASLTDFVPKLEAVLAAFSGT